MSSSVSTTTVVGLIQHDFIKNPWDGQIIRHSLPLDKAIKAKLIQHPSGNLLYILDEVLHPTPIINTVALFHKKFDARRNLEALLTYQAQVALETNWTQAFGPLVTEFQRRHAAPVFGDPPMLPFSEADNLQYQFAMNTRPARAVLIKVEETLTRGEASDLEKHDAKHKKFEDDAQSLIDVVKLHMTTHAQAPLRPIWDSDTATMRHKAIATMNYIRRFYTTFNSKVVDEIDASILAIRQINNFDDAINAIDQVSIFQEELMHMSTVAQPVHKSDRQLINAIFRKFNPHNQVFSLFIIQHCVGGAMANPSIQPLPYGVSESATARQVALMTFDHFKNAIIEYHAVMKTGPDPQEHVFSIKHEHVEPSSSFVFGNSFNTGFSSSSSSSSSNHHMSQKVQKLEKENQMLSRRLHEQQSGRPLSPAGSRSGSPSHGASAFSSNSFGKSAGGGGAHRSPQQKRNFQQSSNPRPTLHPTIKKRNTAYSAHCFPDDIFSDEDGKRYIRDGPDTVWFEGAGFN